MSLEQYNSLMGSILNQWHALAKLRAEIEGKEGRVCWGYRKFGHLACNCRNREQEEKGRSTLQNRFKILASRVIRCSLREKVKVRRQKVVKHCGGEREKKVKRSSMPHRGKSAVMEKGKKERAGTSQLGKGIEIL